MNATAGRQLAGVGMARDASLPIKKTGETIERRCLVSF